MSVRFKKNLQILPHIQKPFPDAHLNFSEFCFSKIQGSFSARFLNLKTVRRGDAKLFIKGKMLHWWQNSSITGLQNRVGWPRKELNGLVKGISLGEWRQEYWWTIQWIRKREEFFWKFFCSPFCLIQKLFGIRTPGLGYFYYDSVLIYKLQASNDNFPFYPKFQFIPSPHICILQTIRNKATWFASHCWDLRVWNWMWYSNVLDLHKFLDIIKIIFVNRMLRFHEKLLKIQFL